MRKEVILAIVIGFSLGLAMTFFVYKTQFQNSKTTIVSPLPEQVDISPTAVPSQALSLTSPIDQSIAKEGKTSVSGVTIPLSWVLILGEKGEKMIKTNEKGNFETDLLLTSGENEIKVTVLGEKGDEISKTVTIVYSTAEI